jgi:hypothetical protein
MSDMPSHVERALSLYEKEINELRAENAQLRETIAEWQEIHGTFTGDVHAACQAEIERLRVALKTIASAADWHPDDMQAFARAACQT